MTWRSMRLLLCGFALCAALGTTMAIEHSVAATSHGRCHCPECDAVCLPIPTTIPEKKHCWEVECKAICIPGIKWWWQSCCELPSCGRVRTVKVLKKVEYECERCGYKWESSACVKCPCDKHCE